MMNTFRTTYRFVCVALLACLCLPSQAQIAQPGADAASAPRLVRFAGSIASNDSAAPINGAHDLVFAIYREAQGGEAVWSETQTVAVTDGKYSVLLGSATANGLPLSALASDEPRWLAASLDGQEIAPRALLVSVPYAMKALDAERFAGHDISEFISRDDAQRLIAAAQAPSKSESSQAVRLIDPSLSGQAAQPATDFAANNSSEVLLVTQTGTGYALRAVSPGIAVYASSSGNSPSIYALNNGTGANSSGVVAATNSTSGRGIIGIAYAASGPTMGVVGQSYSPTGRGVRGDALATTGATVAIQGENYSTSGVGIQGDANATTGLTYGVRGTSYSISGRGIEGLALANTGYTIGLSGRTVSNQGIGLYAESTATGGTPVGLFAKTNAPGSTGARVENSAGGKLISGVSAGGVEKFNVSGAGDVNAAGVVSAAAFAGNGALLTNVTAANAANATSADALGGILAANYARTDVGNTFTGNQSVNGDVAISGAVTYNGGTPITGHLSAIKTFSIPVLYTGSCVAMPASVPGALDGDSVVVTPPSAVANAVTGIITTGYVSSPGVVAVRACASSSNYQSSPAGDFRIDIWKHGSSFNSTPLFQIGFNPQSLTFANQQVNTTSWYPQVVIVLNPPGQTTPINLNSITLNGDFQFSSNNCPSQLAPGASCTVGISFSPKSIGNLAGGLVIYDSAVGSPHTVPLSGVSYGTPNITLSATTLNFPITVIGNSSSRSLTIGNTGNVDLAMTSTQISGSASFSVVSSNCESSIAPGANCTLNIAFAPSSSGAASGTLTITDNASGSPHAIALNGLGAGSVTGSQIYVWPTGIAFPNQNVGGVSSAQSVTISNNGGSDLNLSAIIVTADFQYVSHCPAALAAGQSCTVDVTFTPATDGNKQGTLTISSTDANLPAVNVTLSGATSRITINSLNQTFASAGSSGFWLGIYGTNFKPDSVAQWNGSDRPTIYWGPTYLTVSISSADLSTLTPVSIAVRPGATGGVSSNAASFTIYADLSLGDVRDMVYEPNSQKLLFTSQGGTFDGAIVPVDPNTLTVGAPVIVGSTPNRLALSDDNSTLYVGLDSPNFVRKVDVATMTPGAQFSLGIDQSFGPLRAIDIRVLPGNPNAVAVAMAVSNISPAESGVAIFDDGVKRANSLPKYPNGQIDTLAFSDDGSSLFGFTKDSAVGISKSSVDAGGVNFVSVSKYLVSTYFGTEMRHASGRLYFSDGSVIDDATVLPVGKANLSSSNGFSDVLPLPQIGKIVYLQPASGSPILQFYSSANFLKSGEIDLAWTGGYRAYSLVRWGLDGLAFRTDNGHIILLRTSLLQ